MDRTSTWRCLVRILALMSGGLDSSMAVVRLLDRGDDVVGVPTGSWAAAVTTTLSIWPPGWRGIWA